ncbi:MAG: S8 family serine peptidase [Vulcanibacillus sp.]
MKYIVKLNKALTDEQSQTLKDLEVNIIYKSNLLPILGIETTCINKIMDLSFINYIRESRKGEFQEGSFLKNIIQFQPPVKRSLLISNGFTGWGNIKVAILDSGINDEDNELKVCESIDFTNTGMFDHKTHGTIVAKIIKTYASGANLYIAKVGKLNVDEIHIMKALEWADSKKVDIINISVGFPNKRKNLKNKACKGECELCQLVNAISKRGIAIICAAGNNNKHLDSINCPGNSQGALTVGAIDGNKGIANYSSIGVPGIAKPNLVAPGNLYYDNAFITGTSFAAPLISGILGAILHRSGNITKATEYLYTTLDDLGVPKHEQGLGCLNVEKLVEVIINETPNFESEGQNKSS